MTSLTWILSKHTNAKHTHTQIHKYFKHKEHNNEELDADFQSSAVNQQAALAGEDNIQSFIILIHKKRQIFLVSNLPSGICISSCHYGHYDDDHQAITGDSNLHPNVDARLQFFLASSEALVFLVVYHRQFLQGCVRFCKICNFLQYTYILEAYRPFRHAWLSLLRPPGAQAVWPT